MSKLVAKKNQSYVTQKCAVRPLLHADSIRNGALRQFLLALLTQPRPWGVPLESTADDRLVGRRANKPASNAVQRLILGPTVAGSQRTERTRLRTTVLRVR